MKVLEWASVPRRRGLPGEDVVVLTPNHVAIVDGDTPKSDDPQDRLAGRRVAEAVAKQVELLAPDARAREFIDSATEAVRRVSVSLRPESGWAAGGPAATAVVLSARHREVWVIGDGSVRTRRKLFRFERPLESHVAAVRAAFNIGLLAEDTTIEQLMGHDRGRELVMPLLERQHVFRNAHAGEFRHAIFDGTTIPDDLIEVLELDRHAGGDVVLASDGYPEVLRTLSASEEALAARLRRDPLMLEHRAATKGLMHNAVSFDDRSYVRVILDDRRL